MSGGELVPLAGEILTSPGVGASALLRLREAWLVSLTSPHTTRAYRQDFALWVDFAEHAFGLDMVHGARRVHVDAWRGDREQRGDSSATLARRLGVLLELDHNPAASVDRPEVDDDPRTRALDMAELEALLDAAEQAPAVWGPRDTTVVNLLAFNGFRVSTPCGLDVGDLGVNRRHRTLTYTVKGSRTRTAPVSSLVLSHLDAHHAARRDAAGGRALHPDEPLILANTGGRLTRDGGLAAPRGVAPHVLRSTFATLSRRHGRVSLWDLQEALDHCDPRTTQRYDKANRSAHPGADLQLDQRFPQRGHRRQPRLDG